MHIHIHTANTLSNILRALTICDNCAMENKHLGGVLVALSLNTKDSISLQIIPTAITMIAGHTDTLSVINEMMFQQFPFAKMSHIAILKS